MLCVRNVPSTWRLCKENPAVERIFWQFLSNGSGSRERYPAALVRRQTEASMLRALPGLETFLPVGVNPMVEPYENALSVAASDVNKTLKTTLANTNVTRHQTGLHRGMTVFLKRRSCGSIIVGDLANAADGQGKAPKLTRLNGNKVTIEHLIHGGNVAMYRWHRTQDGCLNPTITNVT